MTTSGPQGARALPDRPVVRAGNRISYLRAGTKLPASRETGSAAVPPCGDLDAGNPALYAGMIIAVAAIVAWVEWWLVRATW